MKQDKTYSQIIYELLNENPEDWHFSYELIAKWVVIKGKSYWLGTSADRLARDLAEKGLIEREGREEGNFYAKYRAKQIKSPLTEEEKHILFEPKVVPTPIRN